MNITIPDILTITEDNQIKLGKNSYIVITTSHLSQKYKHHLQGKIRKIIYLENNELANLESIIQTMPLAAAFNEKTELVAFGGGKVIDATKYISKKTKIPYISIPTTLSNNGICSPIAVIPHAHQQLRIGVPIPHAVIIPLKIIVQAPPETITAGVGDLLSNLSALQDWELACTFNAEKMHKFAYSLSYMSTYYMFYYIIDSITNWNYVEFLTKLAESLMLSGLAMEINKNSRPCSGGEHLFSHTLDKLYPDNKLLHGYKVAFGTLITELIRDNKIDMLKFVFQRIGLPIHCLELGLTKPQLVFALMSIIDENPSRYTIFNMVQMTKTRAQHIINQLE